MDAKTLEALKASIRKWEKNAEAEYYKDFVVGASKCPLCVMFNTYLRGSFEPQCDGCPVFNATGQHGCQGTPYEAADDAKDDWLDGGPSEPARAAAREEVAFLKSLLPEGESV